MQTLWALLLSSGQHLFLLCVCLFCSFANYLGFARTGVGDTEFDTNDWKVPGGVKTETQAAAAFNKIISQAAGLSTGFIVLEHDHFQEEVDLSVGYFLPAELLHQPKFTVRFFFLIILFIRRDLGGLCAISSSSSPSYNPSSSARKNLQRTRTRRRSPVTAIPLSSLLSRVRAQDLVEVQLRVGATLVPAEPPSQTAR